MRSLLFIMSLLVMCSLGKAQEPSAVPVREITPQEPLELMRSDRPFISDCNEQETPAEARVPGASLVVYDRITTEALPKDKGAALVFYCYSPECPAAGQAARVAAELGHAGVYHARRYQRLAGCRPAHRTVNLASQ